MKSFFRTSSLLTAGLALAASSSAFAAGLAPATSTYMTIQPNAAGTHLVYTLSWVAPDTDNNSDGVTEAYVGSFGNANAKLDNANNLEGGDIFNGAQGIQYIHNAVNNATEVQWTDPANYTDGATNPSAISREWVDLGGFGADIWPTNVQVYGSGEGGVTGVFSSNPDGTGASTGTGVGIVYDYDDASDTGLGFLLSGASATPKTGYVQVSIPNPTTTWRNTTDGAVDFSTNTYDASHPFLTGNLIGAAGNTDKFIEGIYTSNGAVELVVTTDATYAPKIALSGDFDSDLDVDVNDIITASGGFTGSGATGNWYADGDTDADGDVDVQDIINVSGNFTGAAAGSLVDTAAPDLIYDPSTGNLTLDADGGVDLTAFQLESAGAFIIANYDAPAGAAIEEGTANVLSYFVFSGGFASADLGNVLATGLDQASLEALLTTASYSAGFGNSGEFDLVVIPEPSSLALLAMGGLMLARRRRAA